MSNSDSKPVISAVGVHHDVFTDLHRRFDRGETHVYTGAKDGSNRRCFRKEDGKIWTEDGREVMDLSKFAQEDYIPLSRYGKLEKQHGRPKRLYDPKTHQFLGHLFQNGEFVPKYD